jgi:GR25 family glycosyltransferase involved in LPS biosynthesis
MYLYQCGGLYFDCKNILYCPLNDLLENKEVFLVDVNAKCANGIILLQQKKYTKLKNYMIDILYNFHTSNYSINCLAISGPNLMSKYIVGNYLKNNICENKWRNSYVTFNKNIVIKVSYNNYYSEDNYVHKKHYGIMYKKKQVYKKIPINYSKINGISGIAWINMNRSKDRRINMEKMFKNIKIHNHRIEAIDGKQFDKNTLKKIHYVRKMTDGEIGCTLSHIKAIQYLSSLKGDYFMIAEDDICFKNLNLTNDLTTIIKKSPLFDILLVSKIYPHEFNDLYTDWNVFLKNKEQVAGTGCYIISRQGINKILNICQYKNDIFHFKEKTNFDVADMFIYQNTKSYIYKYNIVSLNTNYSSSIHEQNNKKHEEWHVKSERQQDKIIIKNLIH